MGSQHLDLKRFRHLKPKIIKSTGQNWHVLSMKHGSRSVIFKNPDLGKCVNFAIKVFEQRVIGRAQRYEVARAAGLIR